MNSLIKKIKELQKSEISKLVDTKIDEFNEVNKYKSWFSELCFCILTSNSKAATAIAIQTELGEKGFLEKTVFEISEVIRKNKHRFHNVKAARIVEARVHKGIKSKILKIVSDSGLIEARKYLVDNVKGLGYKESSHFLRNVGYQDVAILDRHIIRAMHESGLIDHESNSLNASQYVAFEKILSKICKKLKLSQSQLDLYIWYIQTGMILK